MPFPARGSNVKLGKGSLFLDLFDDAGLPTDLQFLGNANSISISAEVTDAELFSSTEASGALIDRAVLRTSYTLTVSLNEFTLTNMKLFLKGDDATKAQTVQSQETAQFTNVTPGRFYETGFRQITNVTVMTGTDTLVDGTDYVLNSEFGIIETRVGAGIGQGDTLDVTFEAPALTIDQVRVQTKASTVARLLYLADDANTLGASSKDRLEIWRVDVAPEGDLNLISEEYGSFSLTMAVLSDTENHPTDPFGVLERVA